MESLCTGLQHIGIPTINYDETLHFYDKLGFRAVLTTMQPDGGRVAFLQLKKLVLEVYETKRVSHMSGAIDHIAVDVINIELVYQKMTAKGFPAIEGEIKTLPFWDNGVRYFTILGPNHEKVEFSQKL